MAVALGLVAVSPGGGAVALPRPLAFPKLRRLTLAGLGLGDEGTVALVRSARMPRLEELQHLPLKGVFWISWESDAGRGSLLASLKDDDLADEVSRVERTAAGTPAPSPTESRARIRSAVETRYTAAS